MEKMGKKHSDVLTCRLEEILTTGATFISWNELYLWYGVQKLAAGTYRDLSNRWDEIADEWEEKKESLGRLMFVQSAMKPSPGIYLFAENMPQPIY